MRKTFFSFFLNPDSQRFQNVIMKEQFVGIKTKFKDQTLKVWKDRQIKIVISYFCVSCNTHWTDGGRKRLAVCSLCGNPGDTRRPESSYRLKEAGISVALKHISCFPFSDILHLWNILLKSTSPHFKPQIITEYIFRQHSHHFKVSPF